MNEVQILTRQTEIVYGWTNKLITSVPFECWETLPEILETSLSWQVGHLIVSQYFHSIMVIAGHQKEILQQIPIKDYGGLFTNASPRKSKGIIPPTLLLEHLGIIQQKSIDIISSLTSEGLEGELEPTHLTHPIAKIKREAIEWNIQHTMYHCGQIGILKRVVDERYDFGLRLPE